MIENTKQKDSSDANENSSNGIPTSDKDIFNLTLNTIAQFKEFIQSNKSDLERIVLNKTKIESMSKDESIHLLTLITPIMDYYIKFYGLVISFHPLYFFLKITKKRFFKEKCLKD